MRSYGYVTQKAVLNPATATAYLVLCVTQSKSQNTCVVCLPCEYNEICLATRLLNSSSTFDDLWTEKKG